MDEYTFKRLSKVTVRYILSEDDFLEQFGDRKAREFYKVPTDGGIIYFDPVTAEQFTVLWNSAQTKARIAEFLERKKALGSNRIVRK